MKVKRAGILTKIIITALVLYTAITLVSIKARTAQLTAQKETLESEVARLSQKNAEYQYEIEHSEDPEIIEDIARSQLGLVMPGEKIFYDMSK